MRSTFAAWGMIALHGGPEPSHNPPNITEVKNRERWPVQGSTISKRARNS